MLNLDPAKLLVIAVVAIILLGPDKLPQVARQVGGAWRSFNEFRHRMETEVRNTMPDLPSTTEIARLARSPSALLDHLSNMGPDEKPAETGVVDDAGGTGDDGDGDGDGAADVVVDDVPSQNGSGAASTLTNGSVADAETAPTADATGAVASVPPTPTPVVSPEVSSTPPGPAPNPRSPDVIVPADPSLN